MDKFNFIMTKSINSESCCEGDIINNNKFDFNANFAVYLCNKEVQGGYITISNHVLIIEAAKKEVPEWAGTTGRICMSNNAVAV